MKRKFRITNVSGQHGMPRTPIPFGAGSSLPPGRSPHRRRRNIKRGRHQAVVSEDVLKPLVGYIHRGQLQVTALDGKPLPSWMIPGGDAQEDTTEETSVEEVTAEDTAKESPEPTPESSEVDELLEMNARDLRDLVNSGDLGEDTLHELLERDERKTVLNAVREQLGE